MSFDNKIVKSTELFPDRGDFIKCLDLKEAIQESGGCDNLINSVQGQLEHRPLGYIRGIVNNEALTRILVDSGNLAYNIICVELVETLDVKWETANFNLGGAATNIEVEIVGKVEGGGLGWWMFACHEQ